MGYVRYSNFVNILQERAVSHPNQVIFTFLADGEAESKSLTYQQLDQQARAIATSLQEKKGKGQRALLLYQPGLEFITAFLGCLYAGIIATPAYPPRPNRSFARLNAIIKDAGAVFALTTESLKKTIEQKLTKNTPLICLATDNINPELAEDWQELKDINQDSIAFLQYTSGSTGTPKGVMVSHGNLIHNSHLISDCFQNNSSSIGGSWLPPYHDMGLIGGILQPIYAAISTIILPPVSFLQRPIRWLKAITKYKITTTGGPNFAYEMCVNSINEQQKAELDLSSWELAFSGAEPVRAETIAKFADYFADCGFRQEAFYPCYGMAETTLIVSGANKNSSPSIKHISASALTQNKIVITDEKEKDCQTLVSSGKVASELQSLIVNPDTLTECQENEVGEIWVKGESVAQGYWQREDLTKAIFEAYTKDTKSGPFLRTGDLGFISDGELFVTGRLKDLIIIRGRNHYPQDIEESVGNCHEALNSESGAAFSVDIDEEEQLVVIFEVKRTFLRKINQDKALEKEIFNRIRQTITENHELQVYSIVLLKTGSIPKTSSGKIAHHACRQDYLEHKLQIVVQWNLKAGFLATEEKLSHPLLAQNSEQNQHHVTKIEAIDWQTEDKLLNIQNWLKENLANRLAITPQEIDIQQPFINYGLDSVQAVRLTADLEDWLHCQLSPTVAYDYPNIETLAVYLADQKTTYEPLPEKSLIHKTDNNKIAIVGMACRFPGAYNCEEYWQLLAEGKDAISQNTGRKNITHLGGYIKDYDQFDPEFFEISTREAINIDPQQRILLEVTYEALENANLTTDKLSGSATGVFIGISTSDYATLQVKNNWEVNVYTGTGNALSIASNRISYNFNLIGPSLSVDTACSSSLVALHLAVNSLKNGECEQAIVGGVNLILAPELTETFQKAGMMAEDGKCKTFDASADGYVRGEGCGVVILKPLAQAIANNNNILAVISGSAINQDGRSNGLTAPSGKAQQRVIQTAWQNAGVNASDISYIEAHGTGTALGDPIELNSLSQLLLDKVANSDHNSCWIGSTKTNIGHLEAAAGMAGLIKTVLALKHEVIPPTLNFTKLNPYINIEQTNLKIATQSIPWQASTQSRFAGISSFGFGGTNAHVIITDFQKSQAESEKSEVVLSRNQQILTLSAKSESALQQLIRDYQEYFENNSDVNFADVCFTTNVGRSHFKHRLALVAENQQDLQAKLKEFQSNKIEINNHQIAFLFTGQGSQYSQMGYELYQTSPSFKETIDYCEKILNNYLEKPLTEILFQPENKTLLNQTNYTQPAIFTIEYALAKLWLSWGIKPSVVMGHSVGEYVAATIAGVFSLEDGLKLIAHRGKLMQKLPLDGGMICLFTDLETANKIINKYSDKLNIAAINSNNNIVISGGIKELEKLEIEATKENIKFKKLKVSHAFHSNLMLPILAEFKEIATEIDYKVPNLEIISNVTGTVNKQEIGTAEYWVEHIIKPVKFAQSIEYLQQKNYQIFLEIGAKPTLLGMARGIVENEDETSQVMWLPSLRKEQKDWQIILKSLGNLYSLGLKINWDNFHQDYPELKTVKLPNYPWQNKRYWQGESIAETKDKHLDWLYEIVWQKSSNSSVINHHKGNYLIFADEDSLGEKLAEKLTYLGSKVYLVYQGTKYQQKDNLYWLNSKQKEDYQKLWQEINFDIDKIIYFWGLNKEEEREILDLEKTHFLGCLPIVYLIQSIVYSTQKSKLWLISKNSQKITNQETINPQGGCLWGLGKVIAIEYPEYWGGVIDVENTIDISLLSATINDVELETMKAIRGEKIYYPRLQRKDKIKALSPQNNQQKNIKIRDEFTYLITGGLGALGLKITTWLVNQGAKNLVLLSRSQPSVEVKNIIATWQQQGINIFIANTDVSNIHSLQSVFEEIQSSMPPLKGIIHAAGVLADGILTTLSAEKLKLVMQPKIQGAWNLHQLSLNLSLDFFVLFSSVASLLGSPGQGNYAAANAYLDSFASYRHSLNLPALSINWGAFDMGMAISKQDSLTAAGIEVMNANEALGLLGELINYSTSQIGVIKINWVKIAQKFPDLFKSPYLQHIVSEFDQKILKNDSSSSLLVELKQASHQERETILSDYLKKAIASILHIRQEEITITDSLLDLGMDSLMVMEAINHLKTDLQLMLYPREFYERPRINALASYLAEEFTKQLTINNEQLIINNKPLLTNNEQFLVSNKQFLINNSNREKNNKPIGFILSSPRSGSTLLRVMLAGHPDLVSPPELHLLPFNTMQERQAELEESHLGEGLIRTLMDLKHLDAEASQVLINQWIEQNLSIAEVYHKLQELSGNRLLIDKSPTYAMQQNTLFHAESLFSQAKYIHLVRHPYSVIESFARMRMDKLLALDNANPYEIGEAIWQQTNQNIIDFSKEIDPQKFYQVNYEYLVTQPEKVMNEICNFLEIPFNESLLNPYQGDRMTNGVHNQSMSVGDPNFNTRSNIDPKLADHWRKIQLPIFLNPITYNLSKSFDYDLPNDSIPDLNTVEMKEEYIEIRDLNLCFCSWGKKDSPLILLVHGILDQGFAWEKVAQPLAEKGYYVVAPDLRGHGKSGHVGKGASYNLLDFVADLDDLSSHLTQKPFTLVGHSLGSVITSILACMRPEKISKLVLIEPVLPVENNTDKDIENIASHLDYLVSPPKLPIFPDIETVAKRLQKATPDLKDDFAIKLAQRMTKSVEGGVTFSYSPLLTTRAGIGFNSISRSQYLQILSQIKIPIDIIYGDRSNFNRSIDLQAQQETMPNATKIILSGGHNLHLETPIKLASVIYQVRS